MTLVDLSVVLLVLGVLAAIGIHTIPVHIAGADTMTVAQWNRVCSSGIGELGQALSASAAQHCAYAADANDGMWLLLIGGGVLLISAAALRRRRPA